MRLVQFDPSHVPLLRVQKAQLGEVRPVDWDAIARCPTWSLIGDGGVVAIAGVIPHWPGRAEAWAMLGEHDRYALLTIHRTVCGVLDGLQRDAAYARLEMVVKAEFPAGHKWARMLGFEAEGLMRRYGLHGEDFMRYARIRC